MLTKDRRHLQIFDDRIEVNKTLPKWRRVAKEVKKKDVQLVPVDPNGTASLYTTPDNSITFSNYNMIDELFADTGSSDSHGSDTVGKTTVNLDATAKMDIHELTKFINDFGVEKVFGWNYRVGNVMSSDGEKMPEKSDGKKKPGFLARLFGRKKKESEVTYELDVISFFENVKLLSKESANTYKDMVAKYLSAVHAANLTGQVALKEKLARGLFVNKYEAALAANGYYYAVTEDQVVKFANKTEKGVELVYLKNFARPLPDEVVKKLEEANSLEVFDNYVVMAYDPNGDKKLETEKERDKRKDPILFGLILGSDKLYYITDWIDEKCDLTLQQFVDTLDIDKESLNFAK